MPSPIPNGNKLENTMAGIILIIHIYSCISGSATCMRTERDGFAIEFGVQNIANVRNQVALPLCMKNKT